MINRIHDSIFFSARVPTLSRAERQQMVDRSGALSISRQCELLGISRSSVYYRARGGSGKMKRDPVAT